MATTPCAFDRCQSGAILAGASRVARRRRTVNGQVEWITEYHPGCWAAWSASAFQRAWFDAKARA